MRITKIDIPKELNLTDGLESITMNKLANTVILAGKNGSGKSRILAKIFTLLSNKPKKSNILDAEDRLKEIHHIKSEINHRIDQYRDKHFPKSGLGKEDHILEEKQYLDQITLEEVSLTKIINWNFIDTNELDEEYKFVKFVPKSLQIDDNRNFTKNQIEAALNDIKKVGIDSLPKSCFAVIQAIQDRWFSSTHQDSASTTEFKNESINNYSRLKELIEIFLNTELKRNEYDEATLFDFPLSKTNLSDGQKILLQFCIAIYSQEVALKDIILVLDEPENHLHPSIIKETIERLQKCAYNGQIWIATHSIPLLAHFDPSLIWYVDQNKITHAGKIPEKVLNSLLGDNEEIAKLQDFINLPAQFAIARHAFECLLEPTSLFSRSNDPQSAQIRSNLVTLSTNQKIRIIDYGVGKGRLISNINDLEKESITGLVNKIEYVAFDKFDQDKDQCQSVLTKIFGSHEKKYYNNFNSLYTEYDKNSFDVVIMCNVLHEIDPKDWINLFKEDGEISTLLKENGVLLLVEDHMMPIGEKAYQNGFLVLDTPHIKDLFKITEDDQGFSHNDLRGDGRLKSHIIPKNCLTRIDELSRITCLKSLSKTAKDKIIDTRKKDKKYSTGKIHSHWIQQFANSSLALDELSLITN